MEETVKFQIISLLEESKQAREISELLDITYTSVLNFKRQYEKAKNSGQMKSFIDIDKYVVYKAQKDMNMIHFSGSLTEEKTKLDFLKDNLQNTAHTITSKINNLILEGLEMSDLKIASDIISSLHTSFLVKNMNQVNIQNNFDKSENIDYANMLNDDVIDEQTFNK